MKSGSLLLAILLVSLYTNKRIMINRYGGGYSRQDLEKGIGKETYGGQTKRASTKTSCTN